MQKGDGFSAKNLGKSLFHCQIDWSSRNPAGQFWLLGIALSLSLTAQQYMHILTKISIVPLAIFVGIAKAWKKEVFSGPSPVLPLGTNTSTGARAPALAGAATLFARIRSRMSTRSSLVNTKPTLPLMWGISLQGNSTQSKIIIIIIIIIIITIILYYGKLTLHEIKANFEHQFLSTLISEPLKCSVHFCNLNFHYFDPNFSIPSDILDT